MSNNYRAIPAFGGGGTRGTKRHKFGLRNGISEGNLDFIEQDDGKESLQMEGYSIHGGHRTSLVRS